MKTTIIVLFFALLSFEATAQKITLVGPQIFGGSTRVYPMSKFSHAELGGGLLIYSKFQKKWALLSSLDVSSFKFRQTTSGAGARFRVYHSNLKVRLAIEPKRVQEDVYPKFSFLVGLGLSGYLGSKREYLGGYELQLAGQRKLSHHVIVGAFWRKSSKKGRVWLFKPEFSSNLFQQLIEGQRTDWTLRLGLSFLWRSTRQTK